LVQQKGCQQQQMAQGHHSSSVVLWVAVALVFGEVQTSVSQVPQIRTQEKAQPVASNIAVTSSSSRNSSSNSSNNTVTATATTMTSATHTWTTSTTTSSTTTTAICFEDGSAWFPLDMLGHNFTKERDAFACQRRCQTLFGCVHFSFFKATLDCHLTDAYALRLSSRGTAGFLSGPFHCWGGMPSQDKYVQLGPKTYVPKELECIDIGVVYMPEMAPPKLFPPRRLDGDLALGLNSIHSCKALCSNVVGCEHFSVHFPDGLCSLAAANARPVPHMMSTISGRLVGGCKVGPVFSGRLFPSHVSEVFLPNRFFQIKKVVNMKFKNNLGKKVFSHRSPSILQLQ